MVRHYFIPSLVPEQCSVLTSGPHSRTNVPAFKLDLLQREDYPVDSGWYCGKMAKQMKNDQGSWS